jgi:hypothetical protein
LDNIKDDIPKWSGHKGRSTLLWMTRSNRNKRIGATAVRSDCQWTFSVCGKLFDLYFMTHIVEYVMAPWECKWQWQKWRHGAAKSLASFSTHKIESLWNACAMETKKTRPSQWVQDMKSGSI